MTKRVLVYLEPCIFRDDPAFLSGHLDCFISPLLNALSVNGALEFVGFASNIFLALNGLDSARQMAAAPLAVKIYPLYNGDLLADADHSLERYAHDVFGPPDSEATNGRLLQMLKSLLNDAKPHCVITGSQNKYLTQLSKVFDFSLLSVEFGPLPRLPFPLNRFVSADGHLSEGVFASPHRLRGALAQLPKSAGASNLLAFESRYEASISAHPQYPAVRSVMQHLRQEGSLSMLALQPEQWMTWEGALGQRRSCASIILEALARLRTDKLVVTFHLDKRSHINQSTLREIWLSDPRLEILPSELSIGLSEVLLPFVDELVTVSSNIAMAAFLLGKPVLSIGNSFAKTLDEMMASGYGGRDVRDLVLRYIEEHLTVDDDTFRDAARLRARLEPMLLQPSQSAEAPPAAAPSPVAGPAMRCVDIRTADLTLIHAEMARRHDLGATLPDLLKAFGRHALGYVVKDGAVGAEFGVAGGYFSDTLLRSGRFARLFSIDRWSDHHDDAEHAAVVSRLSSFGERSCIIRQTFDEALAAIPNESLDFVYVDGYAHTGHDFEIVMSSLPKLKPGGWMAVHDFDRFSWPINHRRLIALFDSGIFDETHYIPPVLTANNEDVFPGMAARKKS